MKKERKNEISPFEKRFLTWQSLCALWMKKSMPSLKDGEIGERIETMIREYIRSPGDGKLDYTSHLATIALVRLNRVAGMDEIEKIENLNTEKLCRICEKNNIDIGKVKKDAFLIMAVEKLEEETKRLEKEYRKRMSVNG